MTDKSLEEAKTSGGSMSTTSGVAGGQKPTEAEYFRQHGRKLGFPDPVDSGKRAYEFNLTSAKSHLQQNNGLMTELIQFLVDLADGYANGRPGLLYYPSNPGDLQILSKPYASVITKVYRLNCLQNRKYPGAPSSGFVDHSNLYDHNKINDLLRARLVCKYMDGPRFVAAGLAEFCRGRGLTFRSYPMHSDTGYHAWHCYIRSPVDLWGSNGIEARQISFELQLSTQLAEVITGLTHGLYELNRTQSSQSAGDEWRWDPRSQRFRSAYLGHTLHLLEGIIQTFRDEVLGIEAVAPPQEAVEANPITLEQFEAANTEATVEIPPGLVDKDEPLAHAGASATSLAAANTRDDNTQ